MTSAYIVPEQVILNDIIKHIEITFLPEIMGSELRMSIDEDKLLEIATQIVKVLPATISDYTDKPKRKIPVDSVWIKIGSHDIKASWETGIETKNIVHELGFKKDK